MCTTTRRNPLTACSWLTLAAVVACMGAARASDLVLVCYLRQSGGGVPSSFIRRVEIDVKDATVSLADSPGAGFLPLGYYGRLVTMDKNTIVFDYASPTSSGRSTINRTDGAFFFTDQKSVTRGTCATSETGRIPF